MKSRVKILVNGAAATLLTGAVAAGLIFSSTGVLQTKNQGVLAARQLQETQEEMTKEQEPETDAELVSAERYQLGMLWENELTAKKTQEREQGTQETVSGASSAQSPLAGYFSNQALVDPDSIGNYLNVRAQADENSNLVNTIRAEQLVSVLDKDGDWTKIGIDDMEGWVKTEYLLEGEAAASYMQENGTLYARVIVPNMNIRLRPSTSSDILDVAYEYDAYEVCLLEGGWVYCVYDGPMKGYLSADCMAVSYSLGETWINNDIALTEENAKLLGVAVSETSAEDFALAASKDDQKLSSAGSDSYDASAYGQEVLSVLSPAQMNEQAAQAASTETAPEQTPASDVGTTPSEEISTSSASSASDMQPSPEETQPTAPQTEPTVPQTQPTTEEVVLTGIEAFYTGTTKMEGEVVCSNEIYIVAAYSDGNYATITEGWASNDIGMMLHAGENIITVFYGGFSSNIVLTVTAAPQPTVPETLPTVPETAPTVPETEPTVPPTEPAAPETTPTEPVQSGNIRVSNVSLSSDLTQYTLDLCNQYGVDSSVIFSVMYHESHFNAGATSPSGAQGLMQIIPRYSADRMAKLGVTNLYDPASNILVGIDLLAEYYYTYGSWNQALNAYRTGNAGCDSTYAATILGSVRLFQTIYYE